MKAIDEEKSEKKYFHNLPASVVRPYMQNSPNSNSLAANSKQAYSVNVPMSSPKTRQKKKFRRKIGLTSLDGLKYPGSRVLTQRKLFTKYVDGVLISVSSPSPS